jgi:hypothetical protein
MGAGVMAAPPIPQPFTAYLPPCLERLYEEGATFGKDDTKGCLRCIALYYHTLAKKSNLEEDFYNLVPMLQFINGRSHDKLADDEIDAINEDVRSTSRTKITCRELKKSATLKECCVSEDCKLSDGSIDSDPASKRAANIIMERGNVLKFLVNQAQKNHIGDTDVLKHILASIACTNSLTSAGIQPELNGEKGHGKTDAVKAVFHLVPERWKLSASISAKALYYHQALLPGSIIFSDDVQWSDDLISTVKRSMGSFQDPQVHFTLDAHRNPLPQVMPPRLAWWLSSVESVADDQLKDRQYSLDIDDGKDHSTRVSNYLKNSRSQKKVRFSIDQGIETARETVAQIKEHEPFKVVIDCAEFADWKVKEDHRTQNKFWDLVEAFAILRFKQRYIDEDGWLHASVEDFNEAKNIFMKRRANHRTHLTNAQTKIVKSVIALQNDPDGATQASIAEDLGISQQAVSKSLKAIIANTRFLIHSPGVHGEEFYKSTVIGLEVVYGEGDIVTLPDSYNDPQLPNNHDTTNLTTNKTTINNNKQTIIQPNIEECNKGDEVEPNLCCSRENGCKVVKSSLDSDSPSLNEVVSEVKLTILRFLHDVPAFVGVDMSQYGPFRKEDVGTVPALNAKGLVDNGVARTITPGKAQA